MADALDGEALDRALAPLGGGELRALLAKAEPSRSGEIRGRRHTMWDDSDINATRHARALVGGVLGGRTGDLALFVSGGAEHQGPDGGGPLAVIVEKPQ
ncbi:Cyanuric acid amidohydrolase [Alcanivorax sp. ALC70]|nr:Cyanuric acid amidohydrolase [Alcanivorax sp. ALC70]